MTGSSARLSVWALLIPADPIRPCLVVAVELSGICFSAAIGGGLLDERVCTANGVQPHTVYQDADRDVLGLPQNVRAQALAAQLNWPHLHANVSLRGDVLVAGLDAFGDDTHVPEAVLTAAYRARMLADAVIPDLRPRLWPGSCPPPMNSQAAAGLTQGWAKKRMSSTCRG